MAGWSGIKPTAFVKVVEADLKEKRNQIAAEALQLVIVPSPVADGAYKGNHRVSVDGKDLVFDLDAQDKDGSKTLAEGMAVIETAEGPYHEVVIQSNIPYGEKLESGHSGQAPHGVYRPAFAHIRAKHGDS
ncbi:hypothetical protein JQS35_11015 [Alcaligenes faecalis subsp. faecalis]|uniref:hypothetical protein n=1 Tax=Alcaligenes faecalis TaxID=511 RepID=UPI001F464F3F|nr:hypothetical protein [Alcaligenes faecalis]MBW4789129.1 hypothetical protein [Alcaligenes faecalis subsp. faecalis]